MDDLIFVDATEPVLGAQLGVTLLNVHDASQCAGRACCIHNPSDHHMRTWRQNWRADRYLMERICPHGIGHPDPDDLSHKRMAFGNRRAGADSIHGCDGCCRPVDTEATP